MMLLLIISFLYNSQTAPLNTLWRPTKFKYIRGVGSPLKLRPSSYSWFTLGMLCFTLVGFTTLALTI